MGAAGGDILAPQSLVDRDRGIYLAHHRGRAAGEAPAPHLIGIASAVRLIVLLLVAPAVVAGCDRQKAEAPQAPAADGASAAKGVDRSHKGEAAPDRRRSTTPTAATFDLAEFKGTPVLVNLWASWCAPCVKELPTLERAGEPQQTAASSA